MSKYAMSRPRPGLGSALLSGVLAASGGLVQAVGQPAPAAPALASMVPDTGSPTTEVTLPPAVTGLSAVSGRVGATMVITGAHLASATQVSFGRTPAAGFTVAAADRLEATVPGRAESGPITLTTRGGVARSAPFAVEPVITGVAPLAGAPGTAVTIRGTGLAQVFNQTWIRIGDRWATVLGGNPDRTELKVAAPAGAPQGSAGRVTVHTPGGQAAVSAEAFTLNYLVPAVTGLAPASGVPGTEVTLTGAHLEGVTEVLYRGVPLFPGT